MSAEPQAATPATNLPVLLLLSALSGGLLFVSDHPLHLWPVQAVALLPLLVGLLRFCGSKKAALLAGLVVGLFSLVPLAIVLEFPVAMAAGLGAYLTVIWLLISLGAHVALRWPAPLGALCAGAAAVLVEWIDFNALPVWGTAQTFARVWSAGPWAIQLVELTGVLGLVFVLVASQALLAGALVGRSRRGWTALTLAALLFAAGMYNTLRWDEVTREPDFSVKVAAIGWTTESLPRGWSTPASQILDTIYRPRLERAVKAGAKLIVSPEVGFRPGQREKAALLSALAALAKKHRVMLAVGYFDARRNDNRIVYFDQRGKRVGEYVKTHLIPFIERYRAGSGQLVLVRGPRMVPAGAVRGAALRRVRVGGMICQDDNFTDLARAYGREGVQLLVVPTNDWLQVKDYHLENALFRGVENRYGVVRAASNGVSVIVGPAGRVLARADHFETGPEVIVAELPLVEQVTLYSRWGDWLAVACLLLLLLGYVAARWRQGRGAGR